MKKLKIDGLLSWVSSGGDGVGLMAKRVDDDQKLRQAREKVQHEARQQHLSLRGRAPVQPHLRPETTGHFYTLPIDQRSVKQLRETQRRNKPPRLSLAHKLKERLKIALDQASGMSSPIVRNRHELRSPSRETPKIVSQTLDLIEFLLDNKNPWGIAGGHKLSPANVITAVVMDAIYKEKYSSESKNVCENPPQFDEILEILYSVHERIDRTRKTGAMYAPEFFLGSIEIIASHFEQNIANLLIEINSEDSLISDIPPDSKWKTIIDPQHVQIMELQGIDTSNPLLCLTYESERGYARSIVAGQKKTFALLEDKSRKLDLDVILAIADSIGVRLPSEKTTIHSGTITDLRGLAGIIDGMQNMSSYGITPFFAYKNEAFFMGSDHKLCRAAFPKIELDFFKSLSRVYANKTLTGISVEETIKHLAGRVDEQEFPITYGRIETSTADLKRYMTDSIDQYHAELLSALNRRDNLVAVARLFHRLEYLHPFKDGNYRVFGKFVMNFALERLGEPLSELYDGIRTEGHCVEDLADAIQQGQKWRSDLGVVAHRGFAFGEVDFAQTLALDSVRAGRPAPAMPGREDK